MRDYLYSLAKDDNRGFMVNAIKTFLFILSYIYSLIASILIFLYRLKPYRLDCKVISVGNITLGGTGKTSLVEFMAKYLKQQGHKVAILSRGYKRRNTQYSIRNPSYETMGDEPYMLKVNLGDIPVIVDANRIRAAGLAMRDYGVDTVILDDGFQQWKIKKDLEVITIDSTNPFGNRYLLPRGILREPISSLKRSDIFVLTQTNLNPDTQDIQYFLNEINPEALIIESIHSPLGFYRMDKKDILLKPDALAGKTVTLFSGIGNPDSFENLIIRLGINIGLSFRFPDHYAYTQKDLENIIGDSRKKNIDTLVTTEKDATRLSALAVTNSPLPVLVLRVALAISKDEQKFHNRLLQLYSV